MVIVMNDLMTVCDDETIIQDVENEYESTYDNTSGQQNKDYYHFPTSTTSAVNNLISLTITKNNGEETSTKEIAQSSSVTKNTKAKSIGAFSEDLQQKNIEYRNLLSKLETELYYALKDFSIEYEVLSKAEIMIYDIADKYTMATLGNVLTGLHIKYYKMPRIIVGICYSLEHFDAKDVYPWGQGLILSLINHPSVQVKERVISLIENWGDKTLLLPLKNIEIASDWMREYVHNVVSSLEGEYLEGE